MILQLLYIYSFQEDDFSIKKIISIWLVKIIFYKISSLQS